MIEKAGVLYFRFFCYLYVLFSFVLIQKKSTKKKKSRLRLPGYLTPCRPGQGGGPCDVVVYYNN